MGEDTEQIKKRAPTLYAIIGIKLLKGLMFAGLALVIYTLSDNDLTGGDFNAGSSLTVWGSGLIEGDITIRFGATEVVDTGITTGPNVFNAIGQLAAAGQQFELILADPPYGEKNIGRRSNSLAQQLLDDVRLPVLLAAGGLLVLGHAKRDSLTVPDAWREKKVLKHGDSIMRFLGVSLNR